MEIIHAIQYGRIQFMGNLRGTGLNGDIFSPRLSNKNDCLLSVGLAIR